MVAFHIFTFLVFAVTEICPHTRDSEIFLTAANRGNSEILAWYEPPVFIKGRLHGKFIVGKGQIFFGCAVISILELICLNVAIQFTYLLQDFIFQRGEI